MAKIEIQRRKTKDKLSDELKESDGDGIPPPSDSGPRPFEIENDEINGRVIKKRSSRFTFRNPFLKQKSVDDFEKLPISEGGKAFFRDDM